MCGNRAYCWKTVLTLRLYGRRPRDVVAVEQDRARAWAISKPAIIRSVVVLPQPDGPSIEKNSPRADAEVGVLHRDEVAEPLGDVIEHDHVLPVPGCSAPSPRVPPPSRSSRAPLQRNPVVRPADRNRITRVRYPKRSIHHSRRRARSVASPPMVTPLGAGYQPRVLWQDTAVAHPVAPGGAARRGRRRRRRRAATAASRRPPSWPGRGRSVAVLDAHDLGWGASTRNGGMVLPELKAGPRALERPHGELGLRLHARSRPPSTTSSSSSPTARSSAPTSAPASSTSPTAQRASAHLDALADELTSVGLGRPRRPRATTLRRRDRLDAVRGRARGRAQRRAPPGPVPRRPRPARRRRRRLAPPRPRRPTA